MKTLYLAGPINGCTDGQAKDWRESVKATLAGRFQFLDPMARDYRGKEDQFVNEIIAGDLEDIRNSDIILVNSPAASDGTAMEIVYAHQMGKTILVACPRRVSPWMRFHATAIYPTLDEAVASII